jgi:hypothetical protein
MRGNSSATTESQGLALNHNASAGARMRSRLRSKEITERKQVGDAESMFNEEPASMREAIEEVKS